MISMLRSFVGYVVSMSLTCCYYDYLFSLAVHLYVVFKYLKQSLIIQWLFGNKRTQKNYIGIQARIKYITKADFS